MQQLRDEQGLSRNHIRFLHNTVLEAATDILAFLLMMPSSTTRNHHPLWAQLRAHFHSSKTGVMQAVWLACNTQWFHEQHLAGIVDSSAVIFVTGSKDPSQILKRLAGTGK
jgi:hypothetical protein